MPMNPLIWIIVGIVGLILLVVINMMAGFYSLWIQARLSNAPVGLVELIAMRLRKVDLRTIVLSRIRLVKADIDVPTNKLESHYLSGGRVANVASAMIAAQKMRLDVDWDLLANADLQGEDVLEMVTKRSTVRG